MMETKPEWITKDCGRFSIVYNKNARGVAVSYDEKTALTGNIEDITVVNKGEVDPDSDPVFNREG